MPDDIPEKPVLFYEERHNNPDSSDSLLPYVISTLSFYRDGLVRAEHENESSSSFDKSKESRISSDKTKKLVEIVAIALLETPPSEISADYNPNEGDTKHSVKIQYNCLQGNLIWLLSQGQYSNSSAERIRLQLGRMHTLALDNRLDSVLSGEGILVVSDEDDVFD